MRAFLITLIIVLLLGGLLVFWLYSNADRFDEDTVLHQAGQLVKPADPEPVVRGPQDYHMLQDQGGIPRNEAILAGLITDEYAYLQELGEIAASDGVAGLEGAVVRNNQYDFCYIFMPTRDREQHLEFNLEGKWDEVHFGFGFEDIHPSDPDGKLAISFLIKADGETVYGPYTLTPVAKPLFAKVDTTDVYKLTFITIREGSKNEFEPVLLDPFLLAKVPAEPADTK